MLNKFYFLVYYIVILRILNFLILDIHEITHYFITFLEKQLA